MVRVDHRGVRVAAFALVAILLCAGTLGSASRVQADQDQKSGLYFYLYPDKVTYACVGKTIQMYFLVGIAQDDSSPLASLVPQEIRVSTLDPLVGKLSKRSWTINRFDTYKRFSYTPTKAGDENLSFIIHSANADLDQELAFPVINCRYRVSIHSEIHNTQTANGKIDTNIFYDGEGHFDVARNEGDSGWTIRGYGTTMFEGYSDGTESGVTCVTSSPGKGAGTFLVEGEAAPPDRLNPIFHFTDISSSIGLTCKDGKHAMNGSIPRVGWLPNAAQEGVLKDLEFSPKGDNQELPISAVNDTRWIQGANQGTMLITVVPETSK